MAYICIHLTTSNLLPVLGSDGLQLFNQLMFSHHAFTELRGCGCHGTSPQHPLATNRRHQKHHPAGPRSPTTRQWPAGMWRWWMLWWAPPHLTSPWTRWSCDTATLVGSSMPPSPLVPPTPATLELSACATVVGPSLAMPRSRLHAEKVLWPRSGRGSLVVLTDQ